MVIQQILIGALLVEAVVETIRLIFDKTKPLTPAFVGALILGVTVCVVYSQDLFALAGLETKIPYIGSVLSGLILARGANAISDVLGKLR